MPFSLTCNYWQFFFLQTIAEPAISITNAAPMSIIQEEFIPSVFGDVPLEVVPLTDEEVHFIQRFGGEEKVVPISEGIIENSQVKILSGPLEGMEACIRKIDRHKRKAWIEIEMFGRMQRVEVGLEIVSKTV